MESKLITLQYTVVGNERDIIGCFRSSPSHQPDALRIDLLLCVHICMFLIVIVVLFAESISID